MMRRGARFFVLAMLAAMPASASAQSVRGPEEPHAANPAAAMERTIVDLIARTEPTVVAISRIQRHEPSVVGPHALDPFSDLREPTATLDPTETTGAGVIIDPAGLVLTQYLAVRAGDEHMVTTVQRHTYPATIKAADPRSGLAVLEVVPSPEASPLPRAERGPGDETRTFPAIPLGDAAQLHKGQFVIAIGNPYAIRSDGEPTASWGIVTNLGRKAPSGTNLNNTPGPAGDYRTTLHHLGTLVQIDAKLGWSAGGGAVVNLRGELVGLMTTVAEIAGHEQPAGYAIPIDSTTRRVIDALQQGREVEYGLLGVTFRPALTSESAAGQPAEAGVTIQQVYPGTPAARAGLEPGDVIQRVLGKAVANVDAVQLAIGALPPGEAISVDYRRNGREASATARLAKLAVPGKTIVTNRPPALRGIRVDYSTAIDAPTLADRIGDGAIDPEGCVVVTDVEPDSAAWRAGVRPGMFISHVGSQRVATPDEFRAAVTASPGPLTLRLTQPVRKPDQGEQRELQVE